MTVVRFLVRRLIGLVVTLLVSSFVVFGSLYVAPGSPIGYLTGGRSLSPATIASIKAQYHLNDPFLTRYWDWLTSVIHGNFGDSIVFRQPVGPLISARIPTTALLVAMAAVIILVVGISAGALAALRGGRSDSGVLLIGSVGIAVPSFVARVTRTTMRAELAREHVETARTRGIPERVVVRRHVFRNALIP
ncbi:MAG TPA: ABC transporter permease, partial [Solirubrobacteraceae bacterium]|nr:ABC transporter permease [Solirubrobacteraceae bacterium]